MLTSRECLEQIARFEAALAEAQDEWTRKALIRLIDLWREQADQARKRESGAAG